MRYIIGSAPFGAELSFFVGLIQGNVGAGLCDLSAVVRPAWAVSPAVSADCLVGLIQRKYGGFWLL